MKILKNYKLFEGTPKLEKYPVEKCTWNKKGQYNENFDFKDEDFDFDEEDDNDFKVGDKVYLSMGDEDIRTKSQHHLKNGQLRGLVNDKYKKQTYTCTWGNKKISEIEIRYDGVKVFRLSGQWPFHEFTNWKKR